MARCAGSTSELAAPTARAWRGAQFVDGPVRRSMPGLPLPTTIGLRWAENRRGWGVPMSVQRGPLCGSKDVTLPTGPVHERPASRQVRAS